MDNNELLSQLSQLMDNKIDTLRSEMTKVVQEGNRQIRTEMQEMEQRFDTKLQTQEQRLTTKIEAQSTHMLMQVAELLENQTTKLGLQYEHEVAGKINALNEETDILRDDVKDHEQRIHTVERKVGIAI